MNTILYFNQLNKNIEKTTECNVYTCVYERFPKGTTYI